MKLKHLLCIAVCFLFTPLAFAEVVKVGLEPLPPLIISKSEGLSIKLLKEVEKVTDLTFQITIMPYNRAKNGIKTGRLDLMGHTPYKQETSKFYSYAQELDWSVPTNLDVYAVKKANLNMDTVKTLKPIGTPRGNKEFIADAFGIPLSHFHEGAIENLIKMLNLGRIKAIIFERASTMSSIKNLKISGIFYQHALKVPASFGLQKNSKGDRLKRIIDAAIKKVDQKKIFKDYLNYMNLPEKGEVTF